jgi:protein kinase/serine/threonine-protein kinase
MTEDILTRLSKIEDLSVTSRTSVMQYKQTEKTTRQIARELGVDHILEGSVRKDGDKVRITAQLIDARNDSHLWAHTYDEEITNIFDVQSQVANDIATQLSLELTDQEREALQANPSRSVTAYDLYLQGREHYRQYTEEANDKAISLFNEALEIESDFAYAYAGLGDAYAQRAFQHDMDRELIDTAIFMGAKAIESDPNLSEGYKALGLAFHYSITRAIMTKRSSST